MKIQNAIWSEEEQNLFPVDVWAEGDVVRFSPTVPGNYTGEMLLNASELAQILVLVLKNWKVS